MAAEYKKYGSKEVDFSAMQAGQTAVADSVKAAITGVQGLLDKHVTKVKDENTLGLAEHFRGQINQRAAEGDLSQINKPIDLTAITKGHANLIDTAKVTEMLQATKSQVETDALNEAFGKGQQILRDTGDSVLARDAVGESLRGKKAHENLISRARQTWTTNNATAITDIATKKEELTQILINKLDAGLANEGMSTGRNQINIIKQSGAVREEDWPAVEKKLNDHFISKMNLDPNQTATIARANEEFKTQTQIHVDELESAQAAKAAELKQYEARSTVPNFVPGQVSSVTQKFSTNALSGIRTELGLFNYNDIEKFEAQIDKMIDVDKLPPEEVNKWLAHAFARVYDGGGVTGNNVNNGEITKAINIMEKMSLNYAAKMKAGTELTNLAQGISTYKNKRAINLSTLNKDMLNAGQNKNTGFNKTGGIQGVLDRRLAEITKDKETVPVNTNTTTDTNVAPSPKNVTAYNAWLLEQTKKDVAGARQEYNMRNAPEATQRSGKLNPALEPAPIIRENAVPTGPSTTWGKGDSNKSSIIGQGIDNIVGRLSNDMVTPKEANQQADVYVRNFGSMSKAKQIETIDKQVLKRNITPQVANIVRKKLGINASEGGDLNPDPAFAEQALKEVNQAISAEEMATIDKQVPPIQSARQKQLKKATKNIPKVVAALNLDKPVHMSAVRAFGIYSGTKASAQRFISETQESARPQDYPKLIALMMHKEGNKSLGRNVAELLNINIATLPKVRLIDG